MVAFGIALSLSLAWFFVHLILGGRQIAAPLRQSTELHPVVRDTQYLCWHLTSAGIAVLAALFALAILLGDPAYAVAATLLAASFTAVGVLIVPPIGQTFRNMPQGWLFLPVTLLGLWGLLV